MCLFFLHAPRHNTVVTDGDYDAPIRSAPAISDLKRRHVPHNKATTQGNKVNHSKVNIDCNTAGYKILNIKDDLEAFDERLGTIDTEKPAEDAQQTRLIEDASPEEKLKGRKLRLKELRANFEESMDRLNDGLVLVKDI